ncbi:hypothetical protein B0I37DRAFT_416629 [Chaetomium sp. MPI-CAGE-AT-0009]|nr:hypothetical protein B0I37DRAFT_416629 [Chaetomium sp. MPI-CAGE-AT-0009]
MLPKLPSLLAIPALLAVTAVAAPAIELPAALAPRDACPTTSRWLAWSYSTTWLATTTITNGWSSLGSVTSTKTEEETRTINTRTTVLSPAVTTLPATTLTPTVARETTTQTWYTVTETVTSPGYAPTSICQVTTVTYTIPSTTHVTYTMDLSYDTTWESTTGHVSTVTNVHFTTVTHTDTKPGSTFYETTITQPRTVTEVAVVIATETATVWEKGCKSYACQQ